jgi:hypothetical protein
MKSADWQHWQAHLLHPMIDALLARRPQSRSLHEHAANFPGARAAAEQAARWAERMGFAVDADWKIRHARCGALERQDNFARLLRRSLIARDRLEVAGAWPRAPFVALGLHWGTGFPALEHLLAASLQPAFVYLPEDPAALPSRSARLYDALHLRALRGFGHSIQVGGAYQAIQVALEAGRVPVVLVDAPPQPDSQVIAVAGQDWTIRLRSGLMRLLADQQIPFVLFRCWHPVAAEKRRLEIAEVCCFGHVGDIAERWAAFLLESLYLDGAQWHFWTQAETFLMRQPNLDQPVVQVEEEGL